jgi:DNA-binding PadR family transcriptional regulator
MARTFQRSPLAMAILALLHQAPMHPYRMQQLIKEWGKDKVINVQRRASLYQTIDQLQRAGLIRIREMAKDEKRPERAIYELTEKGRETEQIWMREALSTVASEFPEFPAAVSFLPILTPEDAVQQLEKREAKLADEIAVMDREIETYSESLPRLFLLESEYMRIMLDAELKWVRSVIDDLHSGQITWSKEWQMQMMPLNTEDDTNITPEDG